MNVAGGWWMKKTKIIITVVIDDGINWDNGWKP